MAETDEEILEYVLETGVAARWNIGVRCFEEVVHIRVDETP